MSELQRRIAKLSRDKKALLVLRNPLSFAQRRLWFLEQLEPGNASYNVPAALRFSGPLDVGVLRRSMAAVVARHAILRTSFPSFDGQPFQMVSPPSEILLPLVSLEMLPPDLQESEARCIAEREARRTFDLSEGPLLRASLLRLATEEHIFLLNLHHIICDGWSREVLVREVAELYDASSAGRQPHLPEVPIQYVDYARWQYSWLKGEQARIQLAYWRHRLEGCPPLLDLPTNRPRKATPSHQGRETHRRLPECIRDDLDRLKREERATIFIACLAVFKILLYRLSGQRDIAVGTPVTNRTWLETEGLVGLFLNMLVLRTEIQTSCTFRQLLARVREETLEAYDHQDLPFELLVDELRPERNLGAHPLFQVMFTEVEFRPAQASRIGLRIEPLVLERRAAKYDLSLGIGVWSDGIGINAEWRTELFDVATVIRLLGHFETLLTSAVANPDRLVNELPILTEGERWHLIGEWNDTIIDQPSKCIHHLFEQSAAEAGDRIALLFENHCLTFSQLDCLANCVAARLLELGLGTEAPVGLYLERSPEMVIGMLGVLKAGGSYVPLDPSFPEDRLAFMAQDAGVEILMTGPEPPGGLKQWAVHTIHICAEEILTAQAPFRARAERVLPENVAYVLYTSGSTGRPKGVRITHRAVVNFLSAMARRPGLTERDVLLGVTTLSFDIAVLEIFLPLVIGARLVLTGRRTLADGPALLRALERSQATVMQGTPATWRLLLASGWQGDGRLKVLCGGEALSPDLADALLHAGGSLWNLYGPTETTVWSVTGEVTAAGAPIPIGRPIANTKIYVLASRLAPAALGAAGDLYIGGDGLARDYIGRADLTADSLIPDPWSASPGARLYRTGDRVRYFSDGRLEFLGRNDQQIKLRGHRIELGEVETILARHPAVAQTAVALRRDASGESCLVAYVVASGGDSPAAGELQRFLRAKLPLYMVPAVFMILDRLPLTPNGKVNRRALPDPDELRKAGRQFAPAQTLVQQKIVDVWEEVLKLPGIGIADNFFELGGHSILATQVMARLRSSFGIEVPLRDLFEAPTVAEVSERIEAALRGRIGLQVPTIVKLPNRDRIPLSFAQQRLWFLDQLEPGSSVYNMSVAVQLQGSLDVSVLERTLAEIMRRHETLRTTFSLAGQEPVQVIALQARPAVSVIDLRNLESARCQALTQRIVRSSATAPFDLSRLPLLRVSLLLLAEHDHIILLTLHHIISDGWSLGLLIREMAAIYGAFSRQAPSPLPELPVQYADYTFWQRGWLQGETLEVLLNYWRNQLSTGISPIELPTDRPRPQIQSYRGARRSFNIAVPQSLRSLIRKSEVTLFALLMAVLHVLLRRYCGRTTVTVGFPVANRSHVEIEKLIGFFANTLALRTEITDHLKFSEFLQRVSETVLGALAHQDMPFEKLVDALGPERALDQNPIFQVMLALQNVPLPTLEISKLSVRPVGLESGVSRFDWLLFMEEREGSLLGSFEYCTDLFDAVTIARTVGHIESLLGRVAVDPEQRIDDIPMLTRNESHQTLLEWNDPGFSRSPWQDIPQLFESQTEMSPDTVAVRWEGDTLTYRELNARSNALARRLRALGVGPDVLVAVHLESCLALSVALLAILKAGGAYLPLDPSHPKQRLAFLLEDAGVGLIIAARGPAEEPRVQGIPALYMAENGQDGWESERNLTPVAESQNLAYVIYTSGSTGRPKGVAMTRGALGNLLSWQLRQSRPAPGAGTLQFAATTFDVSAQEIFSTWCAGGTLVLIPEALRRDSSALLGFLAELRIARLFLPVVALQQLAETALREERRLLHLREVAVAGEQLRISAEIRDFFEQIPNCQLQNHYGPTESHVASAFTLLGPPATWSTLPYIGRPITGAAIHLLSPCLQAVPAGVAGELYIGGAGLARGYISRVQLTAERFIPDAFSGEPGSRLYRTGDLARHLPDGNIEFLGRMDDQIKVRGFRVEPGEIEAVLCRHPDVRQAVSMARQRARYGTAIVAYVVAAEGRSPTGHELRRWLKEELPEPMIPAAFVVVESLPLTRSGKIDRRALPAPSWDRSGIGEELTAPLTPAEEIITGIWSEVLGIERLGVNDNFFDLGGHSLLATRVISRIQDVFGVPVPLRLLFERPTIAGLAVGVEAAKLAGLGLQGSRIERAPRTGALPLSFAQQRLWFIDQLDPGSTAYNLAAAVRLTGILSHPALERSFKEVLRRHEALRTTFAEKEGRPVQVIAPPSPRTLSVVDLESLSGIQRDREVLRIAEEAARAPFDLSRGPLLRILLVRSTAQTHVLTLILHHIVADAWSMGILVREIDTLYRAFLHGRPSPLNELPIQYADFSCWQRDWLQGEVLETHLAYWRLRLTGAPLLLLPTDRPRPAADPQKGGRRSFFMEAELTRSLKQISRAEGVTLFMTLLAAFQSLLCFAAGQDDVVVGADIANRNRRETEGLIGFFVNMLVMRADLAGNPTFRQLLRRVRETALGAFAHQDLPFERVVEELRRERTAPQPFQVVFNFDNTAAIAAADDRPVGDLSIETIDLGGTAVRFELALAMREHASGLRASWLYSTDLFDELTVDRMQARFESMLRCVVANPEVRLKQLELSSRLEHDGRDLQGREREERKKMLRSVKPRAMQVGLDLA